jgi:hypothetical protein
MSEKNIKVTKKSPVLKKRKEKSPDQGVLWLTNSAPRIYIYEPKCGGKGGVAGSQPMSTAVHRIPNKLWRSKSLFNLMIQTICFPGSQRQFRDFQSVEIGPREFRPNLCRKKIQCKKFKNKRTIKTRHQTMRQWKQILLCVFFKAGHRHWKK